ncbi:hypothetical protein RhiirC2_294282 [Rhizophagus irregularis]|uniref:Uncharacterized protein n=1 Tax=Rhizophagus irregularis TaxID=588596 RepID=A0A2N1NKS3_9GLOM|nr:hypothetical protein RhiirC2_294282 [Rhizophagus irregularis]
MYYCPLPAIGTIRQFPPATYRLEDDEEELVQCIKEIKRRLGNIGTMLADNNEASIFQPSFKPRYISLKE